MKKKILAFVLTIICAAWMIIPAQTDAASYSLYKWSEKDAPNYVVTVGKAKVSKKPKKGTIRYSRLDRYGRTGRAVGNITYKMVKKSAGWREKFSAGSDPSGWGKNSIVNIPLYNGKVYRGYMWNRSHLIADSLGGKAFRRNLVKGTRMQNVGANDGLGGMAYTERKVVNYLYKHKKVSVYYSATPVYKGREIIPRAVIVDIKSSDKKLNERVIVYNAAKGYNINYSKGTFSRIPEKKTAEKTGEKVYVSKSGSKYHLSKDCTGLSGATTVIETTKDKAIADGKTLCAICGSH